MIEFRSVPAAEQATLARDYGRDGVIRVPGLLTAVGIEQVRAQLAEYHRDVRPTLPADATTTRPFW